MKCEQCHSLTQDVVGTPSKSKKTKRFAPAKVQAKPETEVEVEGPDGTAAWCVAFSAFIINFIMAGLSRMSGILYVAFIEMFHTDRKGASMPFSVRSSTMNLLGPVVGILGQLYGVRYVSIIGGVLGTISAAACFFVDDITWITALWGGVNGVGTALVTTLTTVVVAQYFDKYKTTASGMSFSGACIGSFIFPPLMENLLHSYGLEGSFLIVAGITMHTIPAAMILRKPVWVKMANRKITKDVESASMEKVKRIPPSKDKIAVDEANGVDLNCLRTNSDLVVELLTSDLYSKQKDKNSDESYPSKDELLKEMEDVYAFVGKTPLSLRLSQVPPKMRLKLEFETTPVSSKSHNFGETRELLHSDQSQHFETSANTPQTPARSNAFQCKPFIISKLNEFSAKSETQILSSFREKTLYTNVLKELKRLNKAYEDVKNRNIFAQVKSHLKIPQLVTGSTKLTPVSPKSENNSGSNGLWGHISNSIKLHTNPLFLLISLCRAVHFITFIPVVTIIVDYAMDKGFMEDDGKYIIAALSVGDLLGRLCLGWVTDRGFISLPKYMMVVMIFQGVSTAFLPVMNTMLTILPTVAVYAMLQGSVFVRHTVLISKYMKKDEQSIASGCVNFLAGLLGFAVPTYVGYFRDTIGSYDGIFYVNGVVGAVTGLLWIFEPCFVKRTSLTVPKILLTSEPKV